MFHKLLLNFTWWVNRKDAEGNNVFEGGFLGLDNIGPIDRSAQLPVEGRLEQSDGTAWMAMFCLNMLEIELVLAEHDPSYEDMGTKFLEHFAYISAAIHDRGLWNEEDGFYYDVLHVAAGDRVPLRVRSMVGLLPLCATTTLGEATLARLPYFAGHFHWFPFSLELAGVHAAVGYEPGESMTNLFGGNWRTRPFLMMTRPTPWTSMPAPSPGFEVPETVKPARSSVMPLAPTMMPLLGQLLTGAKVVSAVIVWPQLTNTGAAPAGDAVTTMAIPSMPTK